MKLPVLGSRGWSNYIVIVLLLTIYLKSQGLWLLRCHCHKLFYTFDRPHRQQSIRSTTGGPWSTSYVKSLVSRKTIPVNPTETSTRKRSEEAVIID